MANWRLSGDQTGTNATVLMQSVTRLGEPPAVGITQRASSDVRPSGLTYATSVPSGETAEYCSLPGPVGSRCSTPESVVRNRSSTPSRLKA